MNRKKEFGTLELDSDFGDSSVFDGLDLDTPEDPQDVGKRRMNAAFMIDLDRIRANDQVRQDFDQASLDELAATLDKQGLINPITVKWDDTKQRYVIIAGERRYRAAKQLGWNEIACLTEDKALTDAEFLERQIVENTHRKDLNALEEARGYQRMMEEHKLNAKQVAERIGVGASKVQRSVRLLTLPEDIQTEISTGVLPKTLLREVQKLKSETEQRHLIEDYKSGVSLSEVKQEVQQKKTGKRAAAQTKKTATINGIKIQVTAKKKVSLAEIEAALRTMAEDIGSDGRGRRTAA